MNATLVHVASGREWRGGQRQTWLLARELQRMGVHDQVVVTGAESELAHRLAADRVSVRPTRWRIGIDPRAIWATRRELTKRPAALLHAHDAHALTVAGVARLGLGSAGARKPTPLVVTRRVTFPLQRRGFWTAADRVIAISPAVRSALTAGGVLEERVTVIPSGVDLDAAGERASPNLHTRLGLATGTPLALSIAALTPEKDHDTLLQAAAQLRPTFPALHWAIAGDGPLRPALERRIRELQLEGTVSLLGVIPDPDRLLADASVFVLSSTAEGLGSSVLAAWARNVPVVATRVGGLADLLGSGGGLLAEPGDSAELAAAVLRIVTDAELGAALAGRGRCEVERYAIRGMAERVLGVYRSCAYSFDRS